MMRKSAVLAAVCMVLSLTAWAQGKQPQCTLSVSPGSGTAPLTVTASGSCTDSQTIIVSQTLDWGDGSGAVATSPTFQLQHTYSTVGTYTVTVGATDANFSTDSASQNVAVTANQPPACTLSSVSPTSGAAPLTVNASGNCTDPDNDTITSTSINWGDGTSSGGSSGSHTYNTAGNFPVTLSATDSVGNTGTSAPVTVSVARNQPPACSLSLNPKSGQAPLTVTASASCTDPENDITSEVLNWGDGATTPVSSASQTYVHTYTGAGNFTVTLTATDSANNTVSVSKAVKVTADSTPACTLTLIPTTGQAPLTVTANASCTDPQNDIASEQLRWGDGATTTVLPGNPAYTHTYNGAGTFTVTLTATDSAGNVGSAAQTVTVTGSPSGSTPSCTVAATPTSGSAPLSVSVIATCNDPQNDISRVMTDFGDGYYLVGNSPTHTYVSAGSYTLTVVASDKAGNTSHPVSQSITVSNNPVLFVGISNGQVAQFTKSGTRQTTLNSNQGGSITGMAFDAAQNLYTTDFTANMVSKFSGNGTLMGTFGSGYNCKPESIAFDRAGNAYVGETGCSHALLKFDAYGNLQAALSVGAEQQGSDWIDLAADQCTILYTSQGSSVLQYNACTRQQMSPFATGLNTGLAVKVLPDGGALVADKVDILRFDSAGRKIMTYTASGEKCWVSLALDSDGVSFWAADYCTSDVVQFDINSGNQLSKFNSGTPANTVFGLAERVPPPKLPPAGPLAPSPAQASIAAGQSATFTLNFLPNGAAAGHTFTLSCADLPANSTCSFSPPTLQAGSSPMSAQLTVTTTGASARLIPPSSRWGWTFGLVLPCLGLALVVAGGDSRHRYSRLILMLLLLACVIPLLSCSGASGNSSPPPDNPSAAPTPGANTPSGAYTVVIHATSGGVQSSTAVNLNVQ